MEELLLQMSNGLQETSMSRCRNSLEDALSIGMPSQMHQLHKHAHFHLHRTQQNVTEGEFVEHIRSY